ncbi:hypothetical protein D7M15_02790 [Streptomyces sp. Z26]|nr:hypothetical protein D7M15_02790 [Streptomyces sp. Z26]
MRGARTGGGGFATVCPPTCGKSHVQSPDSELTLFDARGLLRSMTDTAVRLWRRVHMDLVRYPGCVCRPSR